MSVPVGTTSLSLQGEIVHIACPKSLGKVVLVRERGQSPLHSQMLLLPLGAPAPTLTCFTLSPSNTSEVQARGEGSTTTSDVEVVTQGWGGGRGGYGWANAPGYCRCRETAHCRRDQQLESEQPSTPGLRVSLTGEGEQLWTDPLSAAHMGLHHWPQRGREGGGGGGWGGGGGIEGVSWRQCPCWPAALVNGWHLRS